MPGLVEYQYPWTFTSTGTGTFIDAGSAISHVFAFDSGASTCSYQLLARRHGGTATLILGSSGTLNASSVVNVSVTGVQFEVAPRIKTLAGGTVTVIGKGIS